MITELFWRLIDRWTPYHMLVAQLLRTHEQLETQRVAFEQGLQESQAKALGIFREETK